MKNCETDWMIAARRGDYAAAWAINDAVLAGRDPEERDNPELPYHLRWVWDGRPFRDRHVLVRCYHGLGDTLQFARYLPALRRQVASLTTAVQPELLGLLEQVDGIGRLLPFDPAVPPSPSECDIEIMELPHAMRLAPDQLDPPPYLHATPPRWLIGGVGLCWRAGSWNPDRSISPELLQPLTGRPCVALQPGRTHLPVLNPEGSPHDLAETAALIAGLNLVITVDTMVAHLAGAMDRPTWLMLKHDADWRWMEGRRDSPWYRSMRLYRQPRAGDWPSVVAEIAADLAATFSPE